VAHTVAARLGLGGRLVEAALRMHLLPEAYLEGARYQLEHGTLGHPAYLLGQRSHTGWWHYFPVAFAVKNTPGFLLATAGAVALGWRARRERPAWSRAVHWALPATAVFAAACASRVQIGERYILPVYPYVALLAATAAAPVLRTRAGRLAVIGALSLHVAPALRAIPAGHLTYFNLLAGGPRGADRVLLDSNLDWGQDLPRLAAWMRRRGVERVQLGYHGSDDPARFGIAREDLPGVHLFPARDAARPFTGVVVVSPNLLCGLFPSLEQPYAALRARAPDDRAGVFFVYFMDGPQR
jgi:hypothetical protein